MKNKILLIYPGRLNALYPEMPLPLLYLAWALKKIGYIVEIFDMRLKDLAEIKSGDYLFVGISSLTGAMIEDALRAAKHIRTLNKDVPLVWGGVHVSMLPEQSLESPFVDIVVRGEGELTVQELANVIRNSGNLSEVKGLSYKDGAKIISTPDREYMDLNEIDIELPYELFEMEKYSFEYFPIHTSRGCPFRCGFCYNVPFNKRKYRAKKASRVLDEIEYAINKFGAKKISFCWEDEFFISTKRAKEICQGIIERDIKIEWNAFCRFDTFKKIDEEFLKMIEETGCTLLSFGGESGSQRILDDVINKDIKVDDIVAATRKLGKTKIQQIVSFMSGLPTEGYDDLIKTFKLMDILVKENKNIYLNGIFLYTPYPGTPLYNLVTTEYEYKIPSTLEDWANFGIYRNTGSTWHDEKYVRLCKTLSILTRFPFWYKKFGFEDIAKVNSSERYSHFPNNLIYLTFVKIAAFRWKFKFFKFPIEWLLLEKYLERARGFV